MSALVSDEPGAQAPIGSGAQTGTRRALVLSGGGAQAAYEVGVMKALLTGRSSGTSYIPLDVDVIAGTSAGSINASLFLTEVEQGPLAVIKFLEESWLEDIADGPDNCNSGAFRVRANPLNFASLGCYSPTLMTPFVQMAEDVAFLTKSFAARGAMFFSGSGGLEERPLPLVDLGTFLSSEPLKNLIRTKVRFDKIRSSHRALRIAATNWSKGHISVFSNSDMTDDKGIKVILGSSAIPGVYAPVEIDGDPHCDGGILMNSPLKPAVDAGADELHIVYMNPQVSRIPLPKLPNTVNDVSRALIIGFGGAMNRDIETARRVNEAIALLDGSKDSEAPSGPDKSSILISAAKELRNRNATGSHKPLTVHRYHPSADLGVGWLSFGPESLKNLIEQGFKDAVEHNCGTNKCVISAEHGKANK